MFDLYSGRWTACAERDGEGQRERKEVDEEKGTYQNLDWYVIFSFSKMVLFKTFTK